MFYNIQKLYLQFYFTLKRIFRFKRNIFRTYFAIFRFDKVIVEFDYK